MGKYTLTDPYIYPRAAPQQAPPKPELPLKQAYPGFNTSPKPLQPFEPGLLLICTLSPTYLPPYRDTDLSISDNFPGYFDQLIPSLFQSGFILADSSPHNFHQAKVYLLYLPRVLHNDPRARSLNEQISRLRPDRAY